MTGELVREVGHDNGNPQDDRWDNLSSVTRSENLLNLNDRLRVDNKTGVRGVTIRSHPTCTRYQARLKIQGRYVLLAEFDTIEEAIAARKEAEMKYLK
jgi:hypothetical protein